MPERFSGFNSEQGNQIERPVTPESVRHKAELAMKQCKEVIVSGEDELIEFQAEHPDAKYIIAGTHFTGLDVQAALSQLGDRFDIQVTGESLVKDQFINRVMINQIGADRFTDLEYRETAAGKTGVFNPNNFAELQQKMDQGRTPWMAIHPYTRSEGMLDARIGTAYLAAKSDAWVVPTALVLEGGAMNLETPADYAKQIYGRLLGKTKARYYIGAPLKLDPIENFAVIERVINKRAAKEKVTPEERAEFHRVHQALKAQSKEVAQATAALLPEQYRGVYQDGNPAADEEGN